MYQSDGSIMGPSFTISITICVCIDSYTQQLVAYEV